MALLDEVPAIPTEDISWARLDAKDGENKTNNKLNTSSQIRTVGVVYPEQTPRSYVNYWKNSVYSWIKYLFNIKAMRVDRIAKNFSYDIQNISGLNFVVNSGEIFFGSGRASSGATTIALPDNSTSYIYCYIDAVKSLIVTSSTSIPQVSATFSYYMLYKVVTASGSVTDVYDLRTPNRTIRKATVTDVELGEDNTSFITPYALKNGLVVPTATTSVYGKVKLADNNDINTQGQSPNESDVALDVSWLSTSQARATTAKYGIVVNANNYDFANRGVLPTNVLAVDSFLQPDAYSKTTAAGFVKIAASPLDISDSLGCVTPLLLGQYNQNLLPTGTITIYAGITAPTGWLVCDGSIISNSGDTAALYTKLGTTFGAAGKLPDLRMMFVRGFARDRTTGIPSSEISRAFGSEQSDDFESHSHTLTEYGTGDYGGSGGGSKSDSGRTTLASGDPVETRPKNLAVTFLIKK